MESILIVDDDFNLCTALKEEIAEVGYEAEFVFYRDETNEISPKLSLYIPILRPWTAAKYFKEHPEMTSKAIFYCDSDVVFTKNFNINEFINNW